MTTSTNSSPDVAFYDSGIGGLPYLERFRELNRGVSTCYVADFAAFPYGEKSIDAVRDRATTIVTNLIGEVAPRVIVVACNTASVVALGRLRERFPETPFVGVVPAVKPAAGATRNGRIVVLSTARTAHDPYTDDLVERFAADADVHRIGLPDLVRTVESSFCDSRRESRFESALAIHLLPLLPEGTDTVVLACTHFIHLRGALRAVLPPHIEIVDSVDGVVRQAMRLVNGDAPDATDADDAQPPRPRFYATAERGEFACLAKGYDLTRVDW